MKWCCSSGLGEVGAKPTRDDAHACCGVCTPGSAHRRIQMLLVTCLDGLRHHQPGFLLQTVLVYWRCRLDHRQPQFMCGFRLWVGECGYSCLVGKNDFWCPVAGLISGHGLNHPERQRILLGGDVPLEGAVTVGTTQCRWGDDLLLQLLIDGEVARIFPKASQLLTGPADIIAGSWWMDAHNSGYTRMQPAPGQVDGMEAGQTHEAQVSNWAIKASSQAACFRLPRTLLVVGLRWSRLMAIFLSRARLCRAWCSRTRDVSS
jgi:hypothetical protein